jgi:hypothetical protein
LGRCKSLPELSCSLFSRGGRKQKNRGDELILVIIYIYTYTWKCHKETPWVDVLSKQKCHLFFLYKIGEQKGRTGPVWDGGWLVRVGGEKVGKGYRRVNMVQILCNMCINGKMRLAETIP